MKLWTISIAVLALAAASMAVGGKSTVVSTASLTSNNNVSMSKDKNHDENHGKDHGKGDDHHGGGGQCVPEPLTMLALVPGAAMFIRRRSKKA